MHVMIRNSHNSRLPQIHIRVLYTRLSFKEKSKPYPIFNLGAGAGLEHCRLAAVHMPNFSFPFRHQAPLPHAPELAPGGTIRAIPMKDKPRFVVH